MAEASKVAEKTVKPGDTVHVVCHQATPGKRFDKCHLEAKVEKVYEKGKFVDLIADHEDPAKSIRITRAPRDDTGTTPDTWHFVEDAKA